MQSKVFFDNTRSKWVGMHNGKIVVRSKTSKEYCERKLQEHTGVPMGAQVTGQVDLEDNSIKFSVNERFEFIEQYVKLVAKEKINSFILTGSGGIGKSTAVVETLQSLKMREDTPDSFGGDFLVMKGYSTARGLYVSLFNTDGRILVIDDADTCFKDPVAASLLKAALDDKPKRIISWNAESKDPEIPNRFTYTGRVIFVSNLSLHEFPQTLISRSQKVDVTLDTQEMIDRIEFVFKKIKFDEVMKAEVLAFVKKYAEKASDLNIRSAVALLTLRENFGKDWEKIALYSFTA